MKCLVATVARRLILFPAMEARASLRRRLRFTRGTPALRGCVCGLIVAITTGRVHAGETDAGLFTTIPRIKIELTPTAMASLRSDPREFVAGTVSEGTNVFSQVAVRL